jgi:hypothetical protein
MSLFALIIFGIVLILSTFYIIVYVIYPGSGNSDLLPKITPLNEKKDIYYSDLTQENILGSAGTTVMGFFKLSKGDRTVKFANSFIPLMMVDNNWFLEISPAPVGKDNVSAQLRVKTSDGGTLNDEIIQLPSIPKQKWIFICILRDGRRFDIIYDNKIVASQRLDSYPAIISSPLSIGNKGLDGSVIHVIVNGKRITPLEVERERVSHINTNNIILEEVSVNLGLPGINLFAQCPPGLPCDPVTKPPNNNLYQWQTPYA